jgi:hypothetical protein
MPSSFLDFEKTSNPEDIGAESPPRPATQPGGRERTYNLGVGLSKQLVDGERDELPVSFSNRTKEAREPSPF